MKFRINFNPVNAAPYFTAAEHQAKHQSQSSFGSDVKSLSDRLKSMLGLSPAFNVYFASKWVFEEMNFKDKERILVDDPLNGKSQLSWIAGNPEAYVPDISYSFPYTTSEELNKHSQLICDPNKSLGMPSDTILVFSKQEDLLENVSVPIETALDGKDEYVISHVLDDMQGKGLEMIIRESNYKAAVLYQLIESNDNLQPTVEKNIRSKSVIAAECTQAFSDAISKLGYDILLQPKEDKVQLSIANFATQSKEAIELFVDRVDAL